MLKAEPGTTQRPATRAYLAQFARNCLSHPEHRVVGRTIARAMLAEADGDPNATAFLEYVLSKTVIVGDGTVGRLQPRGLT
jgi:hypothetical protein